MKSNFNFISDLYKTPNIINIKTLKMIGSILTQLEQKLYERSYLEFSMLSRYLYEALAQFAYTEMQIRIDENNYDQDIKKIFNKWNKYNKKDHKPNVFGLINAFDKLYEVTPEEIAKVEQIRILSNEGVHLTKINEYGEFIIEGKLINNTFTFNQIKYSDAILLLASAHTTIKIIFEILSYDTFIKISNEEFNKFIYDNGKASINTLPNKEEFMDILGEQCPFCYERDKHGTINYPATKFKFPFGPYLECDNCKAIMGTNLNLKSNDEEHKAKCMNCSDEDAYYKVTTSLSKDSPIYKKIVMQCNVCKDTRDFDFHNNMSTS